MRKVNIFVEVDEELYSNVIEPHKKQKSFSKLILKLLNGYYEDRYINAYGDGVVEEMNNESNESFQKALDAMKDSMINLNILKEEAESVVEGGIDEFSNSGEDAYVGSSFGVSGSGRSVGSGEEIEEIRDELRELRETNALILELLKNDGSVEVEKKSNVEAEDGLNIFDSGFNTEESVSEEPVSEEKLIIDEPILDDNLLQNIEDDEVSEEPKKEENVEEVNNLLSGLLDGQEYCF